MKTKIVIDVWIIADVHHGFTFGLNPKSRHALGDQGDVETVFVRYCVRKRFEDVTDEVLYMATRMLCPNTPQYQYLDIQFRQPLTGKTLRRLK